MQADRKDVFDYLERSVEGIQITPVHPGARSDIIEGEDHVVLPLHSQLNVYSNF